MADIEIPVEQVPAEAVAALDSAPTNELEIDPVDALDAASLFELSNQKMFSPIEWAQNNPDRTTDPAVLQKLADTHARIRERGFTFSDLPSPAQAAKGVGHMIVGGAKQLWNYANVLATPFIGLAGKVTGQGPGFQEALGQESERRMIETAAGTEQAITGLSQLPGRALGKLAHRAGTLTGAGKRYTEQTEQEKTKAFFDDLGKAQTAAEISQGRGGLVGAISSETQKELEEAGKPIRPEEVETLAAGDPLSFVLFGKAFGAAGGAASKVIPKGAAPLIERAGAAAEKAASTIGGRSLQTAGKLAEWGGKAAKTIAGSPITGAGAIGGSLAGGDIATALTVAAARPVIRGTARGIENIGRSAVEVGRQAATGVGLTPYSQAARDIFQSAPVVASETLKGAAFDLGLAAATSESPQETEAAAAFGTVLGGLKGVGRGAMKVAQGQIITPREWGTTKVTRPYGSFSSLDALHSQSQQSVAPGQIQRANSIREFLGDKVQAYLIPDAVSMETAVRDILIRQGEPTESATSVSRSAANSKGMFTGEFRDDAGQTRRVVLLNEADAAPHEAFHGVQDVLGESANQVVDGLVFQEYAPQWENLGQQYARRLGGTGNWREVVLDRSGWGNAAAAEKAFRDAANRLEAETGAIPTQDTVRALAESILRQGREAGAGWRDILTTEEAGAEANRYLARELAAENFDAAFRHLGSGLVEGNTLPEKLARVIARTAAFFGAEPLAGVRTEGLQIEPRFAVTEAVADLGRSTIQSRKAVAPTPKTKITDVTPTADAEAAKGEALASELAARNPAQAEVLRKISSAVASGQALKIDYRSAPGEPAGSPNISREARRDIIEAFRDMPESARPLWEKTSIPYRLEPTKSKGVQILSWSPEVFAANAHKLAKFVSEMSATKPEATRWSPYEIDPATKSFTADGWQKLYEDVNTFTANQRAGGTGSGQPLKLPEGAAEMKISVPELQESALVPLNQHSSDFINTIFGLPIPETPRVSRKGGTPGNIVAQEIAKANEPLVGPRVVEPGRVRSTSEFKGFPGRTIQEVNPLRARMEKTAAESKVSFPSLIETNQRLNLEHIADVNPAPEAPAIRPVTETLRAGFLPGESTESISNRVLRMTPDEFMATSKNWKGGLTGEAQRIGLTVKSSEEVALLKNSEAQAKTRATEAMKTKDFDSAFSLANVSQFFREAHESATGTGSMGEKLRRDLGEAYEPPFPESTATPGQFLPKGKKPKNEFKILPPGRDGISKAWVLPGGKVEQLGATWHHDWLDKNKAVQEKYGLEVPAFEGGDAEGVRESALKRGFARVNYSRNTGTLTVEARARDWRKQKGAIERLVEENLDDVDNVTIHLLDESVQKVVDSASERLFNYDSDVEKMANLPFISKGEIRGGSQFLPAEKTFSDESFNPELERIRTGKSGGQTFNADGSVWQSPETPSDIVTLASVNVPKSSLTREEFLKAVAPYQELLSQPNVVAGVFAFEQAGKPTVSVDVNAVIPQTFRENTLDFARANEQVAIWDAAKNETVEAGGSGNTRITAPEQMRAATEALVAGEPFNFNAAPKKEFLPSYESAPEIPAKEIRIPNEYIKYSTTGPAWVLSDGRGFHVPNGTFYHGDYARGLADINKFGDMDAFEFQARAGAMRLATPDSARTLVERGGGDLAVSVTLNPTASQLKVLREYLTDTAEDGSPTYSTITAEVLDARGESVTYKSFDNFGKITAGQVTRFLKNPSEAQFLPAEQTGLPGISSGREFDRKAIEGMSQAQLKEYFPEAVIPKKNTEFISDNIVGSPLAKAAGSKEAAVQAFADKLVKDYRARADDPIVKAGEKWYSEFTPLLKKEFGKDSRIFAELLAATSPNNPPAQNFAFALDALRNWKSGKYDKMISKFNEGLDKLKDGGLQKLYERDVKAGKVENPPEKPSDATYLAHFIDKNNLIPLGSSGKRFSMHSVPVLKVLARKWMTLNTGPKTDNFIKNLVGEGDEATIDLWAARSLRRLGYEGFQQRWRILPRNKTSVSDEDFVFSQQVFRKAADELGISPSSLQGGMWYAEKKLWSENGWGRLDLGDYKTELKRLPQLRSGFKSREARAKAEAKVTAAEQTELEILPR